jgi:antitoxin FitA
MSSITIRNIEDALKSRLRVQAALKGHSMEEEARQILRTALVEPAAAKANLAQRIRSRFARLGDVQLPIAPREAIREPLVSLEPPLKTSGSAHRKIPAIKRKRRA